MKSGRKPTKAQCMFMVENGFDSKQYLVERDTPEEMVIVHRETAKKEHLPK